MKISNILIITNIFVVLVVSLYKFDSLNYLRLDIYDDKIHFIIYFILALTVLYDIKKENLLSQFPRIVFILLIPVITEFLQNYTQRTPDIADLYYDYIGLISGFIIIIIYKYVKRD